MTGNCGNNVDDRNAMNAMNAMNVKNVKNVRKVRTVGNVRSGRETSGLMEQVDVYLKNIDQMLEPETRGVEARIKSCLALDFCPNFYLSGTSAPRMEELGMRIADLLIEKHRLPFRGAVKKFTICMPYYSERAAAEKFLARLKENVGIARDCYDAFSGIILIEAHETWAQFGGNEQLALLGNYIADNRQICFILLFPEGKNASKAATIFRELSGFCTWARFHANAFSAQRCTAMFRSIAVKLGYSVAPEAVEYLQEQFFCRSEEYLDAPEVIAQMFRQILLDRSLDANRENSIQLKDIEQIGYRNGESRHTVMGFVKNM